VENFERLIALGEFFLYNDDYNTVLRLIQRCPQGLYEKLKALVLRQKLNLFDSSRKNIFSCVMTQKKIPLVEKIKFFKLFQSQISTQDFCSAVFSIDQRGNHVLSLACQYNNTPFLISLMTYLQEVTALSFSDILNYASIHNTYSPPTNPLIKAKKLKRDWSALQTKVIPINLYEVALELSSEQLINYLIQTNCSPNTPTYNGSSITKQCIKTKNLEIINLCNTLQILNPTELPALITIPLLRLDFCLKLAKDFISKTAASVLFKENCFLYQVIQKDKGEIFEKIM